MKRKGFTLVELLAVIAILAILVIIALPNVIKLFNNAKKNTFLTEVKSLYNSASAKYISESLKGNKLSEINSNDSSKLDLNGNLVYKIKLDSNGKIKSVAAKKGDYCIITNKESSEIEISDVKEDCDGFSVLANWYDECKDKNTLRCKMLSDNKAYNDSVKSEFVASNSGINFKEISSDTNGKGLYYSLDSDVTDENNDGLTNRIYYYRGDINNNFVVLGDKCYKILRTTENGNVKLMYYDKANSNGTCNESVSNKDGLELISAYNSYNYFDNTYVGYMYGDEKLRPHVTFYDYLGIIEKPELKTNNIYYSSNYTFKNGKYYLSEKFENGKFNDLCSNKECKIENYYTCISISKEEGCSNLYQIFTNPLLMKKIFVSTINVSSNTKYAKSIKYTNGQFSLEGDTLTGSVGGDSVLCNPTDCKIKDYYFLVTSNDAAIYKVLGYSKENYLYVELLTYGTTTQKEALSNKNDSSIKLMIDAWYKENIEDKNLSSKIADEIYCNDRSLLTDIDEAKLKKIIMKEIENENINELMVEYGYDDETTFINDYLDFYKDFTLLSLNGLNYNSHFSQYDSLYRIKGIDDFFKPIQNAINQKDKPSYKCMNKEDRFTTSSLGNSKLKYPTATLTLDEVAYAGGTFGKSNKNYFLANNDSFWTMTPAYYNDDMGYGAHVGVVSKDGTLTAAPVMAPIDMSYNWEGNIIPTISLKSDVEITKGTGIISDPYTIK